MSVALVEECAFRSWPALEVAICDGWRLRHAAGFTRRANSVWPNVCGSLLSLDERIGEVTGFYAARRLPPRIQVGPLAQPDGLDAALGERGWTVEAPATVLGGDLDGMLTAAAERAGDVEAVVLGEPDATWMDLWGDGRRARESVTARSVMTRTTRPAAYALARVDGRPAAVGRGVLDSGWVGVSAMATREPLRRRGAASAVLRALGAWARLGGARSVYLQVSRDNDAALALYARAGLEPLYGYHYRRGPETPAPQPQR